jgi:RNA-binding protein
VPKKAKPRAPLVPLTGKQKSHLRALAHKLKPVVQIGHQGLTEGVLAALEVALERHELIKVKVSGEAEVEAADLQPEVEKATKSQVAQIIGHTLVVYRRRDKDPKIVLPRVKPAKAVQVAKAPRAVESDDLADDDDDDDDDFADDDDEELE